MTLDIKSLGFDKNHNRSYKCPMCGETISIVPNTFYGRCPACQATLIDYKPKPHQENFHKSNAQIRLNIGGFGSGKTTMCCSEMAAHAISFPGGRSLITAPTLKQVKEAVIPELDKFMPPWVVKKRVMSPVPKYILENGHEIVVYASTDEQNLRSLNLTAFYIEEASNVDKEIFDQLQARLRNKAAVEFDELGNEVADHTMGLICTNPDESWVRDEVLMKSSKIFTSKSIDRTNYDKLKTKDSVANYHSFLSSSRDNDSLPMHFIRNLIAGKTRAWIRKYIDCYLDVKEGAVYSNFMENVIEPFPIPETWKRVYGFDKGYRDETAMTCGAIHPLTGIIYIYDEYYVAEQPMGYHAVKLKEKLKNYTLYLPIQADPTVCSRNERDGNTYQKYMYSISGGGKDGVWLEPANNNIDIGIDKVRNYLYEGKLKIFTTCDNLKSEARDYIYKPGTDKPVDKRNHLMDAMRYMISPLPENPNDFNTALMPGINVSYDSLNDIGDDGYIDDNTVIGGFNLWSR